METTQTTDLNLTSDDKVDVMDKCVLPLLADMEPISVADFLADVLTTYLNSEDAQHDSPQVKCDKIHAMGIAVRLFNTFDSWI